MVDNKVKDAFAKYKRELIDKGQVYLRIKVVPGANKTGIKEKMLDETLKITLTSRPEKGRANQELLKFLAKEFVVGRERVKVISGGSGRLKLIKIS